MTAPLLDELVDRWRVRWPESLALWSRFTRLREPVWCLTEADEERESLRSSFAMIRLVDQAVIVSLRLVTHYGLDDFALEVLGHEIGHHVLCPADLTDQGRMIARMRWALPTKEHLAGLVANLYADLLINDRLQRQNSLSMAGVYRRLGGGSTDRLWTLYMRTYEILWSVIRGELATGALNAGIEADAQLCARLVRVYGRQWMDGAGRFAALCFPYLADDDGAGIRAVLDAWRDAEATGTSIPAGLTGIEPGEREGAIHPAFDPELGGTPVEPPAAPPEEPAAGQAASPGGQFRQPFEYGQILRALGLDLTDHEVAVRYYRERAVAHLVPFPSRKMPESTDPLPEGLEGWDSGEALEAVDWAETVRRSPVVIPGLTTVQRAWGTQPGAEPARAPVDLDLYIDSSGSMPNPQITVSYLALAGAIIALSGLRSGSSVQATLWSGAGQFETTGGFVSDERRILEVITGFIGGSTAFPIHELRDTYASRRRRPSHILVISDDGVTTMFDNDERGTSGEEISRTALERCGAGGTMVLNLPMAPSDATELAPAIEMGWDVHTVRTWEELVAFASAFARRSYGG